MNGLDSPLEALTFAPVNLGTVMSSIANNLWAWLAVITATLSIWRLRTTKTTPPLISLSPPPSPPPTKPKTTTTRTTSFQCTDINQMREKVKEAEEEGEALTRGNSKKFFTVYFEERENINNQLLEEEKEEDDHNDDEAESRGVMVIKRWGSSSELRMKKRGGDFGWYNYQNRKVIDGSVVRLWEEERESACPSRRTAASVLA